VECVGIDWASRRAVWCALDAAGELLGGGVVAADLGGLAGLVARHGLEVWAAVQWAAGEIVERCGLGCGHVARWRFRRGRMLP
jgi:hypothetical protein